MTAVVWSSVAAADFEAVVAVLICAAIHPDAQRVRPARGDRGVDVYVPLDATPHGLIDVYQLKSFTGSLTSGHKRQITGSFERARSSYPDTINSWNLVVPIDETPPQRDWFQDTIQTEADFPCRWHGTAFLDRLAAQHPEVIDYYLGNGRARLEAGIAEARDLLAVAQQQLDPDDTVTAGSTVGALGGLLGAINAADPFYDYAVFLEPTATAVEHPRPASCVVERVVDDGGQRVIVQVVPKFRVALEERPIPFEVSILVPASAPEAQSWNDFVDYGTPVTLPAAMATVTVCDLPGGLGADLSGLDLIQIQQRGPELAARYRLLKLAVDSDAVDHGREAILQVDDVGRGKHGMSITAHQLAGALKIVFRVPRDPSAAGHLTLTADYAGATIDAADATARFVEQITPGARLTLRPIDDSTQWPMTLGPDVAHPLVSEAHLELLEDLRTIAAAASARRLLYPTDLQAGDIEAIRLAARLCRGERVVEEWTTCTVTLDDPRPEVLAALARAPQAVLLEGHVILDLPPNRIDLGVVRTHVPAARLAAPPRWNGRQCTIEFEPADGVGVAVRERLEHHPTPAPGATTGDGVELDPAARPGGDRPRRGAQRDHAAHHPPHRSDQAGADGSLEPATPEPPVDPDFRHDEMDAS